MQVNRFGQLLIVTSNSKLVTVAVVLGSGGDFVIADLSKYQKRIYKL